MQWEAADYRHPLHALFTHFISAFRSVLVNDEILSLIMKYIFSKSHTTCRSCLSLSIVPVIAQLCPAGRCKLNDTIVFFYDSHH